MSHGGVGEQWRLRGESDEWIGKLHSAPAVSDWCEGRGRGPLAPGAVGLAATCMVNGPTTRAALYIFHPALTIFLCSLFPPHPRITSPSFNKQTQSLFTRLFSFSRPNQHRFHFIPFSEPSLQLPHLIQSTKLQNARFHRFRFRRWVRTPFCLGFAHSRDTPSKRWTQKTNILLVCQRRRCLCAPKLRGPSGL